MDATAWETRHPPSVSRACGRCRARKVKCDLQVPRCGACRRQDESCDITDGISYAYAAVADLQRQIRDLQARLDAASANPAPVPAPARHVVSPVAGPASRVPKEAEEIGLLSFGLHGRHADSTYVGSAAGSAFARIFFKQIHLDAGAAAVDKSNEDDDDVGPPAVLERNAALPPPATAQFLLRAYVGRVHVWWPFLALPALRRAFAAVYDAPRACDAHARFLVFAVLALGAAACADNHDDAAGAAYARLRDPEDAASYFATARRFAVADPARAAGLPALHTLLLLGLWLLGGPAAVADDPDALWLLSRHAVAVAVAAGLHRRGPEAGAPTAGPGLGADERELRARAWWCVYALERHVAVATGRVLAIRDHAVDAAAPAPVPSLDALAPAEAAAAPVFHHAGVAVFAHRVALRRVAGRALECVYIARGADGRAPLTSFPQLCAEFRRVDAELAEWKAGLAALGIKGAPEAAALKVEYNLLRLLVHRPSPTFMVPSHDMVAVCSRAVASTLRQWARLRAHWGAAAVCGSFEQLHAVVMVGLAGLYCDWRAGVTAHTPEVLALCQHGSDVAKCLDLLDLGIARMPRRLSGRVRTYRDLLQAARLRVYGPDPSAHGRETAGVPAAADNTPAVATFAASTPDFGIGHPHLSFVPQPEGLQAYVDQLSGFFNESPAAQDEGLVAWYDSIMNEVSLLPH